MKMAYDPKLMKVLKRTEIEDTNYTLVEYSYNGKPSRLKVVQEWQARSGESGEKVLIPCLELCEMMKILPVMMERMTAMDKERNPETAPVVKKRVARG